MSSKKNEIAPFGKLQGIASENVPAYSNEYDDFISFEACYIHGIYTGYKWQCVEYARRWLLVRKSCIFPNISSAAHMWNELKYIERVTDGRQFPLKTHVNGSPTKPMCEALLIYPIAEGIPFGHVAIICDVQDDFIRVAEQNYLSHYWTGNYSRQIPLIKKDNLYYVEDKYYEIFGWMEIENNDQLKPLTSKDSILRKYQQKQPIGCIERCNFERPSNHMNCFYYKANEDFLLHLSRISNELYRLYVQTIENIVFNDELLIGLGIKDKFWSRLRQSWINEHHLDIFDHLDLQFDGKNFLLCPFKINDPFTIFECTIQQEKYLRTMKFDYEFTSSFQLHCLLIRHWKRLNIDTIVHILIDDNENESNSVLFMTNIMKEAGIDSKVCFLPEDLLWKDQTIVDKDGEIVKTIWKVWNWERVYQYCDEDERLHPCLDEILLNEQIRILEPMWKSITTHPAFLPILYTMFPNHPNILEDMVSYDQIDGYFDIPPKFLLTNTSNNSQPTIVSWIIGGIFSGFSLCHNRNDISNVNKSLTHCCLI